MGMRGFDRLASAHPASREKSPPVAPSHSASSGPWKVLTPPTREDPTHEAFAQNKLEALGLQRKTVLGTSTPVEHERLGVLRAQMDDFWAQKLGRAARLGAGLETAPSSVQRQVTKTNGQELTVRNMALAAMGKATGNRPSADYGVTPSVFNGQEYPPTAGDRLLQEFVVDTQDIQPGYRTTVQVPNQTVSWVMELPTAGPWASGRKLASEFVLAQIEQDMEVPAKDPIRALDEPVSVIAEGDPSNQTLASQIRTHEHKHVKNTDDVVDEILQPWDDNLEAYALEIGGKTSLDPLSMALGMNAKVPTKAATVSQQVANEIKRRDLDYHASPNGRDPKIVRFRVEGQNDDKTVRIWLRLAQV